MADDRIPVSLVKILPFRDRAPLVTWGDLEQPISALGQALAAAGRSGDRMIAVYRWLARVGDHDGAMLLREAIDLAVLRVRFVRQLESDLLELARKADYAPPPEDAGGPS